MSVGNKIGRFYNYDEDKMVFSLQQWRSRSLYRTTPKREPSYDWLAGANCPQVWLLSGI